MNKILLLFALIGLIARVVTAQLDGGWSDWSGCSRQCDTGITTRTCTNPAPEPGGQDCVGATSMVSISCC
jgi:hypothetical protein